MVKSKISKIKKEEVQEGKVEVKKKQPVVSKRPAAKPISFKKWFTIISKERGMQEYLFEILKADFKARGLTENELKSEFDKALKLFGM
jgi:hypothetical protein